MPPKRKTTKADVSDASAAVDICPVCTALDDTCAQDAVHHDNLANVFSELPMELALAQIVGVCKRLSSHICGLRRSDARTNVRALQDCVDNLTLACNSVSFAVADLKALETALHMKLGRVGNALDEAVDQSRQRVKRRPC
jgi:hypothetical protein